MKRKTHPVTGFFRSALKLLTDNWGLKLLSLLLALIVYHSMNNILSRRLQQSNNVGNKFVLGLDSSQDFEVLSTQINGLFYISGL